MKKLLIVVCILAITFLSSCVLLMLAPVRAKNYNKLDLAAFLPVVRADAPLVIEKLEILRLGLALEKEYTLYINDNKRSWDYPVALSDGRKYYDLMECLDLFSPEEIDAINYLLFSDELQINAQRIYFGAISLPWATSGASLVEDGSYEINIHYYETNEMPEQIQKNGDYVEELGNNYWIIFRFTILR